MSNQKMTRSLTIAAGLFALTICTACGVRGKLDTAPPMWGKAKKEYEEKRADDAQLEKQQGETKAPPHTN